MMAIDKAHRWWMRSVTLLVWAVAAASVTFWVLRISAIGASSEIPRAAATNADLAADSAALSRLLGSVVKQDASAPALAVNRFVLLGVVADRSNKGAALIAVDGKPGKPYRVGSQIEEGLVLKSVGPRRANLGPVDSDGPLIELEMQTSKGLRAG